jgi:chemotaxis protein MotB
MRRALPLVFLMSAGCLVPRTQLLEQQQETDSCYQALRGENASKKELSAALEKLQSAVDELAEERQRLVQEKGSLQGNLASLEGEVNKRLSEVRRLTAEKSRLEEQKATLEQKTETYDALVKSLKQEMKDKLVEVSQQGQRLTVNVSDRVLFDSGSADVKSTGRPALERIAAVLAKVSDRRIDVEGHTDNLPISGELAKTYPTNWELSVARATHVVRVLEENGVSAQKMAAVGKSHFRPVAKNTTPQGRQQNRRIEIVLTPWDGTP